MGAAFLWGALAGASLLIGCVLAIVRPPQRVPLGLMMAFGSGVLLSAVAYELIGEALETDDRLRWTTAGFFAGAAVFTVGDILIARYSRPSDDGEGGSPLAIVLGAMLDGIPESAVLGLTLLQTGEIGAAMLVAVFISNLPEGAAATSGLLAAGWKRQRIVLMWASIAAVSAVSAALGYALLDGASTATLAFILAFAAGAILTMLATSMMPEAYEFAGRMAGFATVLGFAVALAVNWLEG